MFKYFIVFTLSSHFIEGRTLKCFVLKGLRKVLPSLGTPCFLWGSLLFFFEKYRHSHSISSFHCVIGFMYLRVFCLKVCICTVVLGPTLTNK